MSSTRSALTPPSSPETADESEPQSVRAQSAIVRTLADAIAHHEASGDAAEGLREQLVEEMDRLGSCRLEAAAAR
jgi:hypothetical protein